MRFLPDDIVKKIYDDGLKFKLVYDEYKGFRDEYDLTDEKLDQIRKKVNRKLTDDQLDDMIEEAVVSAATAEASLKAQEDWGNSGSEKNSSHTDSANSSQGGISQKP